MTDQPTSTLVDRALQRLRKLASGNGVEPAAITILQTSEDIFTLGGTMEVSPLTEVETITYAGGVKGKDRKILPTLAAMQQAVEQHRRKFRDQHDWLGAVTQEIKTHESQGWGLENAKVTLPLQSAIYAASETCPTCQGRQMLTCAQCNGQGTVTCTQCQGQGRETCYHCGGRGENPQQPGQRCLTCNGSRFAPCRFCQSRGVLPCPTCNGNRGTTCPACQGNGKLTQECTVTCAAETHFKLLAGDIPSGLRRGLDRIGVANLGRGHADITSSPPPVAAEGEDVRDKPPFPVLTYRVTIPYAEMRVGIGGKKAVVAAVGKRCALNGVPNFLDSSLQPWRDTLRAAAQGRDILENALEARALKEILALTVAGKARVEEVWKLYPFGLSAEAIKSMLSDMRLALNRTTLRTRTALAVGCVALSAGWFYVMLMMGLIGSILRFVPPQFGKPAVLGLAGAIAAAALGASWAILNFSTRWVLKRRFPQLNFALTQKIGKTGYSMLGAIAVAFIVFLLLSPLRLFLLG